MKIYSAEKIVVKISNSGKKKSGNNTGFFVGLPGFEPRQTESKSVVLPLHHNPIFHPMFVWVCKNRDFQKKAQSIL